MVKWPLAIRITLGFRAKKPRGQQVKYNLILLLLENQVVDLKINFDGLFVKASKVVWLCAHRISRQQAH